MNDVNHNTHGPKTHNRPLIKQEDVKSSSSERDSSNRHVVTTADAPVVPVFSSPQNRSTSSSTRVKYQESSFKNATLPFLDLSKESSTICGGGQGGEVPGKVVGGGERGDERGGSLRGSLRGQAIIGSFSLSVPGEEAKTTFSDETSENARIAGGGVATADAGGVDIGDASPASVATADPTPRKIRKSATDLMTLMSPRSTFVSPRKGRKSVQEVLGALPILIVDDSVSILKMTKRAILNECANIRSALFIFSPTYLATFSYIPTFSYTHINTSYTLLASWRPRTVKKRLN